MTRATVIDSILAVTIIAIWIIALCTFGFGDHSLQGTFGLVLGVLAGILGTRLWGR
jgi:hypothetical protein